MYHYKYYTKCSEHFYYYLLKTNKTLSNEENNMIINILDNNPNETYLCGLSNIKNIVLNSVLIGYKMNIISVFNTNFLSILNKLKINSVIRCEKYHIIDKTIYDSDAFDMMVYQLYDKLPDMFVEHTIEELSHHPHVFHVSDIQKYNNDNNLGFDEMDINNYSEYFNTVAKRKPTNIELFDLSQSNSEHSRHWFFNANIYIDDVKQEDSLFSLIKKPLKENNTDSLVAFSDNSSVIKGGKIKYMGVYDGIYQTVEEEFNPLLTVETHNFPTGIAPFEGATTGVGGRLRDVYATGRGGLMIAGIAGYAVGNLLLPDYQLNKETEYDSNQIPGWKILIEASNGASDYGNKIGEPLILGFTRNYGNNVFFCRGRKIERYRYEWFKPIMLSGGIGMVNTRHLYKEKVEKDMLIIRAGGSAFRLGLGGGSASSVNQDENKNLDNAVQRGNAEMENRLYKFVRTMIERLDKNPMLVVHDQGAGGPANVTREIVDKMGGIVDLNNLNLGDETLSSLEKWVSEFQESITFLINENDLEIVERVGNDESVEIEIFGKVNDSGHMKVIDSSKNVTKNDVINETEKTILDFDIEKINMLSQKSYRYSSNNVLSNGKVDNDNGLYMYYGIKRYLFSMVCGKNYTEILKRVFSVLSVGSKRFLVNKVDRSVSGLVVQQQTCGYAQIPVSDYGLTLMSLNDTCGIATSIGEQPIKSLVDVESSIKLSIGEMLTNLMFVKIKNFESIKCSGNWMASPKLGNEGYLFHKAVKCVSEELTKLGIAIDGGKDSLSMTTNINRQGIEENVKSPLTFVITSYAFVPNVYERVTPDFKKAGNLIMYVNLGNNYNNMGGSALYQAFGELGQGDYDVDLLKVRDVFKVVQKYLSKNVIYAGHDRSDGGLITTLSEMAFSGNKGFDVRITQMDSETISDEDEVNVLFNEELGIVLEVCDENYGQLFKELKEITPTYMIGNVTEKHKLKMINWRRPVGVTCLDDSMEEFRNYWEKTSFELEKKQTPLSLVKEEKKNIYFRKQIKYRSDGVVTPIINKRKVGVVREVGSNGEREMAFAFKKVGHEVYDITTNMLLDDPTILNEMDILAFVGGFSYSDVLGSANGWASVLMNDEFILSELNKFRKNNKKYALGICNGFQLLTLLGWFDDIPCLYGHKVRIVKNDSKRFESRFVNIKIDKKTNNEFLKYNKNDILGVWSAHGEGKIVITENGKIVDGSNDLYTKLVDYAPIKYIDDSTNPTTKYPFNPNGSRGGMASLSSYDNRILGIMPHIERSFLKSQCPFDMLGNKDNFTPWILMFI
jgi:phosphoribosylformylglycinamidine synthase